MKKKKKVNAAILIIGNEILSGRTQDKNISALAKWLNKKGILVKEVRVIGDNINEIVYHVKDLKDKFNYVFTVKSKNYEVLKPNIFRVEHNKPYS